MGDSTLHIVRFTRGVSLSAPFAPCRVVLNCFVRHAGVRMGTSRGTSRSTQDVRQTNTRSKRTHARAHSIGASELARSGSKTLEDRPAAPKRIGACPRDPWVFGSFSMSDMFCYKFVVLCRIADAVHTLAAWRLFWVTRTSSHVQCRRGQPEAGGDRRLFSVSLERFGRRVVNAAPFMGRAPPLLRFLVRFSFPRSSKYCVLLPVVRCGGF